MPSFIFVLSWFLFVDVTERNKTGSLYENIVSIVIATVA